VKLGRRQKNTQFLLYLNMEYVMHRTTYDMAYGHTSGVVTTPLKPLGVVQPPM
jgi:hypothetical protein